MTEFLARLLARPWVAVELVVASLVANLLALASSIFVILVLNRYVGYGVDTTLATITAGAVLAIAMEFGFRQLRLRLAEAVSRPRDRTLRDSAFALLTGARTAAVEALPQGLRREVLAGVDTVQSAYAAPNLCALLDVPMVLIFVIALFLLNATIATVVCGFLAAALVLSLLLLASLKRPIGEMAAASARRGGVSGAAIAAGDTVRAFNAKGFLRSLWDKESHAFEGLKRGIVARQFLVQSLTATATALMTVAITTIGAVLVVRNQIDIGAMIGANILATRALAAIARVGHLAQEFARARQALDALGEFARLPLERRHGSALTAYGGGLELKDLGFAHAGATTPLFESLSLRLEPGAILVVSGGNGAGKTTLARLLLGLLEPRRGQILVDGVDLQQVVPEWWRRQVVYLPQEPRLLVGSLRDNLRVADPDLDDAAVSRLVERAGLRAYVDRSAAGLDAPVAGTGDTLSLGIRRRVALARALATDGMLGVFDEPTEGLDAEGAAQVYRLMNELAGRGRTIVAFSHDPHILKGANVIVDLDSKPVPRVTRVKPIGDRGGGAAGLKEAAG